MSLKKNSNSNSNSMEEGEVAPTQFFRRFKEIEKHAAEQDASDSGSSSDSDVESYKSNPSRRSGRYVFIHLQTSIILAYFA